MSLITLSDITVITGLSDLDFEGLIPYAEAQAEAKIGFLNKETKTKTIYVWDSTDTLKLEHSPINSVSSITYQSSASSDEETFETDEYRVIADEGFIIFDSQLYEGYTVKVTYEVGWDSSSVTNILKLFLVALTINLFYSLRPEETTHSQILIEEKIGDYAKRYANIRSTEIKSLDQWVDYLATLVTKGDNNPEARSV